MAFDVSTDYKVFDGAGAATYIRVTGHSMNAGGVKSETTEEIPLSSVLRQMATEHEQITGGGAYGLFDTKFQIPVTLLKSAGVPFRPKAGDRIRWTADLTLHHITHHENATLDTRYRVFSRRVL